MILMRNDFLSVFSLLIEQPGTVNFFAETAVSMSSIKESNLQSRTVRGALHHSDNRTIEIQ